MGFISDFAAIVAYLSFGLSTYRTVKYWRKYHEIPDWEGLQGRWRSIIWPVLVIIIFGIFAVLRHSNYFAFQGVYALVTILITYEIGLWITHHLTRFMRPLVTEGWLLFFNLGSLFILAFILYAVYSGDPEPIELVTPGNLSLIFWDISGILIFWLLTELIHGFIVFICSTLYRFFTGGRRKKERPARAGWDDTKEEHYRKEGLDDEEIKFFRQEMATARDHIYAIEEGVVQTARIRTIAQEQNIIPVCQSYFQKIVANPRKIGLAGDFLYKYLPNLHDLIENYNEVSTHVAKNKQTYQILDRSAQVIEDVCQKINDDYISFNQEVYDELEDDIKFAERNLGKDYTEE